MNLGCHQTLTASICDYVDEKLPKKMWFINPISTHKSIIRTHITLCLRLWVTSSKHDTLCLQLWHRLTWFGPKALAATLSFCAYGYDTMASSITYCARGYSPKISVSSLRLWPISPSSEQASHLWFCTLRELLLSNLCEPKQKRRSKTKSARGKISWANVWEWDWGRFYL